MVYVGSRKGQASLAIHSQVIDKDADGLCSKSEIRKFAKAIGGLAREEYEGDAGKCE